MIKIDKDLTLQNYSLSEIVSPGESWKPPPPFSPIVTFLARRPSLDVRIGRLQT